jgi:hypothetical protein
MGRLTLALASVSLATLTAHGSAHAQSYVYEEDRVEAPAVIVEPAPRVYGYYYNDDRDAGAGTTVIELQRTPGVPGGCGEYFYWNGMQCVDARNKP